MTEGADRDASSQARLSISKSCPHSAGSVLSSNVAGGYRVPKRLSLDVVSHLSFCAPSSLCTYQSALHWVTISKDIPPSRLQTPWGQSACRLHLGTPYDSGAVSCLWYLLHNCVKWKLASTFGTLLIMFSLEAQNTSQHMDAFQRFSPLLKSEALCHTEIQLPQAITYYNWEQPGTLCFFMPDEMIFEKIYEKVMKSPDGL